MTAAAESTWDELQAVAADKRARQGGFACRVFLEYVDQEA